MTCPKCASAEAVKNGKMRGNQRYRCKFCGCNYTQSSRYRIDRETRVRCIRLYLEGVGFRGIARLTGMSHVIVQRWVKQLGDTIERLPLIVFVMNMVSNIAWRAPRSVFRKPAIVINRV